jgi:heterokaryon incompatibility protein (HET)
LGYDLASVKPLLKHLCGEAYYFKSQPSHAPLADNTSDQTNQLIKMPTPSESESNFTQNPQTCENCRRVGLAVQSYRTTAKDRKNRKPIDTLYDTNLGTFQEIFERTSCPVCYLLVQRAKDGDYHWKPTSKLRLSCDTAGCFYIKNDHSPYSSLEILPLDDKTGLTYGLQLDRQWIDMSRIKTWVDSCIRLHSNHCGNLAQTLRLELPSTMMLIDIHRKCLVVTKGNEKYYALSYVWGQCKTFQTLTSNLAAFQQEGAISMDNEAIPATIRDAMRLVMLVGESYLWVDALCIVQDNDRMKYAQLKAMPSIYANASVTIIAAQGKSANYGIRGIPYGTAPRDLQRSILEFLPGSQMVECESVSTNGSTWQTRAWTFQEDQLSARKLIFAHNSVQWECFCAFYEEDRVNFHEIRLQTGCSHPIKPSGPCSILGDWPQSDYTENVQRYNPRDLTYDKDILNAFVGITRVLNESLGEFYFGMPRNYFPDALLWEPILPLRRRQLKVPAQRNQLSTNTAQSSNLVDHDDYNVLPSWSWVGWHGAIRALSTSSFRLSADRDWKTNITSSVQWYIVGVTGQLERFVSSLSADQPTTNTLDTSRESLHDRKQFEKLETGGNVIAPSASSESTERVPQISVSNSLLRRIMEKSPFANLGPFLTPFLVCHTARTFFFLWGPYRPVNGGFSNEDCLSAFLIDCRGQIGGKVFLNTNNEEDAPRATTCELIAISTSLISTKPPKLSPCDICEDEVKEDEDGDEDEQFIEMCNVLWIEWLDGVAYRKAPGYVVKELWDIQPIDWIDVTLG